MDKVKQYQQIIHRLLGDYARNANQGEDEVYLIADDSSMNYLLYHNVWKRTSRSYGCFFHARIKNEKVYIEYDGTDFGFAYELVEAGIPKKDIVLAFHAPAKRQYTEFGY